MFARFSFYLRKLASHATEDVRQHWLQGERLLLRYRLLHVMPHELPRLFKGEMERKGLSGMSFYCLRISEDFETTGKLVLLPTRGSAPEAKRTVLPLNIDKHGERFMGAYETLYWIEAPFEAALHSIGKRRCVLRNGMALMNGGDALPEVLRAIMARTAEPIDARRLEEGFAPPGQAGERQVKLCGLFVAAFAAYGNGNDLRGVPAFAANDVRHLLSFKKAFPKCVRRCFETYLPHKERFVAFNALVKTGAPHQVLATAVQRHYLTEYTRRGKDAKKEWEKVRKESIEYPATARGKSYGHKCMKLIGESVCPFADAKSMKHARQCKAECAKDLGMESQVRDIEDCFTPAHTINRAVEFHFGK